jgi:hypothetical protein
MWKDQFWRSSGVMCLLGGRAVQLRVQDTSEPSDIPRPSWVAATLTRPLGHMAILIAQWQQTPATTDETSRSPWCVGRRAGLP